MSSSIEINTANINKLNNIITTGQKAIVLFYWNQCGHCIEFKNNIWTPLMNTFKFKIPIFHIEQKYSNLIIDPNLKVFAFPSLYYINNGKKVSEFNSNRTIQNVKKFIEDTYTTPPKKVKKSKKLI
jgi:thioredoxin-like negative regulator of GroEL